uniref:Uncharacterized protein n=1 Tax=Strombidium rassoulzadegani TaxID=1082188 RepID=A0A7S3FVB5_9SPIT|mmetsp:Transcript_19451/g.33082  ORF Transcript_19451/g.33082 Transcript_19451/m.33082 type:complete len:130 (+) Transcript_19451:694-1083(+)
MGSLSPPSQMRDFFNRYLVDLVVYFVPSSKYFLKKKRTQEIKIRLDDQFDNSAFPVQRIKVELFKNDLKFMKVLSATVKVETVLSGLRHVMREYFFTCSISVILALSVSITFVVAALLLILKILLKIKV